MDHVIAAGFDGGIAIYRGDSVAGVVRDALLGEFGAEDLGELADAGGKEAVAIWHEPTIERAIAFLNGLEDAYAAYSGPDAD